ncbi:MAG: bifunctional 2-C-methyl-D-erythritol 4-phosphate cytidylyltransferase/2-C-methyl-D-erythritol 2,4-cyclodiphosphate synthase, partial [Silicimonas sp.]|nr:bifunctional 2-C-methyl-D-erythritol 4-phosphate cytidylyltransferase/2-C-methyl-D-erythritol 2,4-cyclodiphosphate synthase [Silicimonas sp.]
VAVAVEAGLHVRFVKGSEQNYKITTDDDYARALSDIAAAKD